MSFLNRTDYYSDFDPPKGGGQKSKDGNSHVPFFVDSEGHETSTQVHECKHEKS